MLDKIIAFITANPILFVAIAFLIYKQWQAKQPWPDFGGRITSLKTAEAWQQLLSDADKAGKVVVVDAYATWCPPCKAAAPVYAKMSEEYSAETTVFAKFNTDEARELAILLEIRAMPTFKVFKGKQEVGAQQGWSEAEVRKLLEENGAKKAALPAPKAE